MKMKISALIDKIKGFNPITAVVAISLCLVLIFGIILGTVLLVQSVNTCISLNGVRFSEGVCRYFASSYKTEYIASLKKQGIAAFDTESFWSKKTTVDGEEYTYGELLKINTEAYVKGIIVGNYLFDRYGKLTADDKEKINEVIDDTLAYKASSSKKKFNELSKEYGFDYSDFADAVEYKYKAEAARNLIYGEDSSTTGAAHENALNEYYTDNYSRVMLVLVRTKKTFVLGEGGNLVITTDELGNSVYEMRDLSEGEIAERASVIDEIKEYIDAKNNGTEGDTSITPEYLASVGKRYQSENNQSFVDTGYYFAKNSAYTSSFPLASVVNMVMDLDMGRYSYTEYDDNGDGASDGVCFALRMPLEDNGYTKSGNKEFFSDFYSDFSAWHYAATLEELAENVVVKDKFYEIDFISLPYNSLFGIKF